MKNGIMYRFSVLQVYDMYDKEEKGKNEEQRAQSKLSSRYRYIESPENSLFIDTDRVMNFDTDRVMNFTNEKHDVRTSTPYTRINETNIDSKREINNNATGYYTRKYNTGTQVHFSDVYHESYESDSDIEIKERIQNVPRFETKINKRREINEMTQESLRLGLVQNHKYIFQNQILILVLKKNVETLNLLQV